MALYNFQCGACEKRCRRFLTNRSEVKLQTCDCGSPLMRDPNPPSTQVMETFDTGLMARKVVRLKDADALHRDRSRNDPRLKEP